jgi:hypothetical protein
MKTIAVAIKILLFRIFSSLDSCPNRVLSGRCKFNIASQKCFCLFDEKTVAPVRLAKVETAYGRKFKPPASRVVVVSLPNAFSGKDRFSLH